MAATHIIPPCHLGSTWSTDHRSCNCTAAVLGGEVRWGDDTVRLKRLSASKRFRPHVSSKKAARWRRAGICSARLDFRGNSAEQAREEDAATLMEMTTLVDDLFKLNEAVNEANKGIGADVRDRVDVLYNRASLLKYSADNMVAAGGRVPVQLTATLKALQRDHASVENIVRLVMEAGPVITGVITDVEVPPRTGNFFSKGAEVETTTSVDRDVMFKEKEESEASPFESLTLQSSLKVATGTEEYAMSAPVAADDLSPLAAFRREVQRRVMEQLVGKKKPTKILGVSSEEQGGLGKGDGTSENVLEPIQNLPLRGRLPRRRETGAAKEEADSADPYGGEIDDLEALPQMLQGTQDQSSLADAQQQSKIVMETEINSKELEKLRNELSALEQQLANAKEGSVRADKAESQLEQLREKIAATVPLDIHEQVVKLERQSLNMARKKIAQVTAELREKEVILGAVKQEMSAEQDRLLGKVRMLSSELSKRLSAEEVMAAIRNAVLEMEVELRNALQSAESMKLELETHDKLLKQLQKEWDVERTSLRGELASVKEQLTELQQEQIGDRAKLVEAAAKVIELEDSVTRLQQSMVEAEEERIGRETYVLATVKSLVSDMVKTKRVQGKSNAAESSLSEATEAVDLNDRSKLADSEARRMNSAGDELESTLSDEKVVALENFFNIMGALIHQDSVKLKIRNHRLRNSTNLKPDLRKLGSFQVDVNTKPTITLYYESSWEFAYLHYSADSVGWTELPGVCMRNDIVVNNMPRKVINIEGSSIEFVLTDGRGSWDW
ncbi:hypothetical protein M758_4G130800 [Ceratodon purpureus]|nr:hypothetical protein M758_4G130800 [Ceratodon purpureus]